MHLRLPKISSLEESQLPFPKLLSLPLSESNYYYKFNMLRSKSQSTSSIKVNRGHTPWSALPIFFEDDHSTSSCFWPVSSTCHLDVPLPLGRVPLFPAMSPNTHLCVMIITLLIPWLPIISLSVWSSIIRMITEPYDVLAFTSSIHVSSSWVFRVINIRDSSTRHHRLLRTNSKGTRILQSVERKLSQRHSLFSHSSS